MPRPTPQTLSRTCPECSVAFTGDARKFFCTSAHKVAWNNRNTVQGGPLVLQLKAWRLGRHVKGGDPAAKYGFAELCLAIDRLNAEDKAAGRPSAVKVLNDRYRHQGLNPAALAIVQAKKKIQTLATAGLGRPKPQASSAASVKSPTALAICPNAAALATSSAASTAA